MSTKKTILLRPILLSIQIISFIAFNSADAAKLIDLRHQPKDYLQRHFSNLTGLTHLSQIKKISSDIDFNQVKHTRYQEFYAGYPVWNATFVVHEPQNHPESDTTMNGVIYEFLAADLASTPQYAFDKLQKEKVSQKAKLAYEALTHSNLEHYRNESIKIIIYLDEKNQAHYAYLTSFAIENDQTGLHQPTMIIDATSLYVYEQWDQVMTMDSIIAGGIGGNEKIGKIIYDGDSGHLPGLKMQRFSSPDDKFSTCYFKNDDVIVNDTDYLGINVTQQCLQDVTKHNNVAWLDWDNGETSWLSDEVNNGYSPSIDAFYAGTIVTKLYQEWYGISPWTQDDGKTPTPLIINVHYGRNFDNAMFIFDKVLIGDGGKQFYPLTSLDVIAHEVSHGFTWQHAHIGFPEKQMAALNESFSDMASAAVLFYVNGKNDWKIASTLTKLTDALRYMDDPKKDGISIDHMKDYNPALDAHYIMGIPNKAFYYLAATPGWDTHKAFNIMVKANMHYWTSSMKTFSDAACGVISAAYDYHYNIDDVKTAFAKVGVDTSAC